MSNLPSQYAPTRNVALFTELVSRIQTRGDGLPGMGCFYGPTGYGKSKAVCCAAVTHRAYFVQFKSIWTRKFFLEKVLQQMCITPARTMPAMVEQIGGQLAASMNSQPGGRPLIIDEADMLVGKGMVELVRDIYESSDGTVILVGEEGLPAMLEVVERVHGRMLDWVAAQPTDMEDAREFAALRCPGLTVADDLLESIINASNGSARYVCTNLNKVAEFATMRGLSALDTKAYTGDFFTGAAPARRQQTGNRRQTSRGGRA